MLAVTELCLNETSVVLSARGLIALHPQLTWEFALQLHWRQPRNVVWHLSVLCRAPCLQELLKVTAGGLQPLRRTHGTALSRSENKILYLLSVLRIVFKMRVYVSILFYWWSFFLSSIKPGAMTYESLSLLHLETNLTHRWFFFWHGLREMPVVFFCGF